jgi:hypothetical protein
MGGWADDDDELWPDRRGWWVLADVALVLLVLVLFVGGLVVFVQGLR